MGCVLGIFGCCFGSAACSLCCACCPSTRNSLMTRLAYGLLLLIGTVVSCLFSTPKFARILSKIPMLCKNETFTEPASCNGLVGYMSVYRIQFSMACFFLLMALLMLRVKRSDDPRSGIQNGFWFFKIAFILAICLGIFFIPNRGFASVLLVIGSVGAFIFIFIQLILIIDFAHSWNENWVGKGEEGSKKHYFGLVFFTTSLYSVSVISIVLLYVYYASRSTCSLNICFITSNVILCLIISIVSVLPTVQNYHSTSGLLQSSFVTLYVVYLTWSAMTSEKADAMCNPTPAGSRSVGVSSTIALMIFFGAIGYSAMTSSRKAPNGKLLGVSTSEDADSALPKADGGKSYDDEKEFVAYNYSLFHLMLCFASFYLMMTLTNWVKPVNNFSDFAQNHSAVWVKIVSSWICVVLYFWSVIAPCVFRNREFS